ncbi:hypothetical protein HY634_04400 [Candidatus Uhrbacteria bacterium]|nr:hypothetical protein [Candidatus Uhrbacteria bacterium]
MRTKTAAEGGCDIILAMTWHDVGWFLQNVVVPVATCALLAVTAWYARTTRRILTENKRMVVATKEMAEATRAMAETSQRSYLASLAPQVQVIRADYHAPQGKGIANVAIRNAGSLRFKVVALHALAGTDRVSQPVQEWVRPKEEFAATVEKTGSGLRAAWLEIEDVAGQRHDVSAERGV